MSVHGRYRELVRSWLGRQLPPAALAWLDGAIGKVATGAADRDVYLAVSLVSRKIGKSDLALTEADRANAEAARPGWRPDDWSADQAARLLLVLAIGDAERMASLVDQLCTTADVAELITFYRGLPLYPEPERYSARAREGARSNMKAVFNAVAHRNPYPRENFDEAAWNQMVLKALFIGSPLWPIQGLDERSNPALAQMLCNYAHERWAAHRSVSPELWRCVGRHADAEAVKDLERVLRTGSQVERCAATLALADCKLPGSNELIAAFPGLSNEIDAGRLSWSDIRPD